MRGLQSLAVSLVEIRGTTRYLMGKVPSLKAVLKCLVSSSHLLVSGFSIHQPSRKGIQNFFYDRGGDLLGVITGDHQQNKGESNPA